MNKKTFICMYVLKYVKRRTKMKDIQRLELEGKCLYEVLGKTTDNGKRDNLKYVRPPVPLEPPNKQAY